MSSLRKLNNIEEAEVVRHIKKLVDQGFLPQLNCVADMAN